MMAKKWVYLMHHRLGIGMNLLQLKQKQIITILKSPSHGEDSTLIYFKVVLYSKMKSFFMQYIMDLYLIKNLRLTIIKDTESKRNLACKE